jgi:hypothetical protein
VTENLSCPLCGHAVAGRNAAEVLAEHQDMVKKAKAATELAAAFEALAYSWGWSRPDSDELKKRHDDRDCMYRNRLETLRDDKVALRAALDEWRESTGDPRRRR